MHFHDGLVIVAHCPVNSLIPFAVPKSYRKLPASGRKWHCLGVHPSDYGLFEVEVVSEPEDRVQAIFLAHVHPRYQGHKDSELERGEYHQEVIAADLKGQTEFSWGEVGCNLREAGQKEWLVVAYTKGPHVPTPPMEVIRRFFEHDPVAEPALNQPRDLGLFTAGLVLSG